MFKVIAIVALGSLVSSVCSDDQGVACDRSALIGDVDDDGAVDRVVQVFGPRGDAVVRACFDDGSVAEVPGTGMGEHLELSDIDRDGRVEVVYGTTTVSTLYVRVAVWDDEQLAVVTDPDGAVLELVRGGTGRFDEATSRWPAFEDWGCADLDADGSQELVTVEARLDGEGYEVTLVGYRLDGRTAVPHAGRHARLISDADPTGQLGLHACAAPSSGG